MHLKTKRNIIKYTARLSRWILSLAVVGIILTAIVVLPFLLAILPVALGFFAINRLEKRLVKRLDNASELPKETRKESTGMFDTPAYERKFKEKEAGFDRVVNSRPPREHVSSRIDSHFPLSRVSNEPSTPIKWPKYLFRPAKELSLPSSSSLPPLSPIRVLTWATVDFKNPVLAFMGAVIFYLIHSPKSQTQQTNKNKDQVGFFKSTSAQKHSKDSSFECVNKVTPQKQVEEDIIIMSEKDLLREEKNCNNDVGIALSRALARCE